jgi:hypothetical protein
MRERRVEKKVQKRGSLCAKKRIFVYKLDSFVGFIGDQQVHAQECYESQLKIKIQVDKGRLVLPLGKPSKAHRLPCE